MEEIATLKGEIAVWSDLEKTLLEQEGQLAAVEELVAEAGNEESVGAHALVEESKKIIDRVAVTYRAAELEHFLSGEYDQNSTILSVIAGAGGRDASDWAGLLIRMYQRYAEQRGWSSALLHEHKAPEGGIKSSTIQITGKYAYGWLKGEVGVHRLVRISPYDSNKRRHTSFAMVEAAPVLPKLLPEELAIKPEEVKMEAAKSSGPGGQNVNKRETAVRLTHIPTGLVVECQAERTQGSNRELAMQMLAAKLVTLRERERREELLKERGEHVEAAWGNQIRSYVLQPYQMVKDHRTNVEHRNPEAVLDGDLTIFIEAEIELGH